MLNEALNILKLISDKGYEAYIVGGFVRDYLLKRESYDIDITTNMPIVELSKLYKIDNVKHGSFNLYSNDYVFEVTLFRKELSYSKQRHPDIELVNSFKEDYIRRDFTINALAMDFNYNITDYCNGLDDLSNKVIKTIREPNTTFIEDPVRILRAIYFKNKLGFNYESTTYESLLRNVEELSILSNSRIIQELSKMINTNFKLFIEDIIKINAYKQIFNLENTLMFIYKNDIDITSIKDLLSIHYYLGNDIKMWEINSKDKKRIINIINKVNIPLSNRLLFDSSNNELKDMCVFNCLIGKKNIYDELISSKNNLCISKISDIDFDFSKVKKVTKDIIVNNILDNKLKNNKDDIIKFINMI